MPEMKKRLEARLDLVKFMLGLKKPRYCNFIITEKCNSRCRSCNIWKITNPKTMNLETVKQVFRSSFFDGLKWFQLTGGEPFLHPELVEIVEYLSLRFNRPKIWIPTNGLLTDQVLQKTKQMLPHNIGVTVSLDGKLATHNKLRGGAFYRRTVETIQKLSRMPLDLSIGFTITQKNWQEIQHVYQFATKHQIHFSCRPEQLSQIYYKTEGQNVHFPKHAIHHLAKFFYKTGETAYRTGILKYVEDPNRMIVPCTALKNSFHLAVDATLYPCLYYNRPIGKLTEANVTKLWHSLTAEQVRREIANGKCPNCWVECESMRNIHYFNFPWRRFP